MAPTMQKISANYDHVLLTPEEEKEAIEYGIRLFKKNKETEQFRVDYLNKLNKPKEYPKWNCDYLRNFVLSQNKNYVIDEGNKEIFEMLCMYFSGDPAFELEGMSLKKGIMLFGPIGCGKTSLMKMFAINTFKPFAVVPCRVIADKYSSEGATALNAYSELAAAYPQQNFGHSELGRCFDDLGTEDSKKNYGNEVNVMQDIIYKIYDNELIGDFHITTNLSGDEIETAYGTRIRSRLREMFNVITFDKSSPDRRK